MSQYSQDKRITIKRLDFHYRDWGGSGRSLVLLHGLASTCRIWDLVAPILSGDYSVVAPWTSGVTARAPNPKKATTSLL